MVIAMAVGTSAYLEWFLVVPNISTDSGFTRRFELVAMRVWRTIH